MNEYQSIYASMFDTEQPDTVDFKKYLTFDSNGLNYAIPIEIVRDILIEHPITYMPCVADYVRGIMNLRGQIHPVVDVRQLMGHQRSNKKEYCVIVIEVNSESIGLYVDNVSRVIDLRDDDIFKETKDNDYYVLGMAKEKGVETLFLDCSILLDEQAEG